MPDASPWDTPVGFALFAQVVPSHDIDNIVEALTSAEDLKRSVEVVQELEDVDLHFKATALRSIANALVEAGDREQATATLELAALAIPYYPANPNLEIFTTALATQDFRQAV
jgi:hypothetical protein